MWGWNLTSIRHHWLECGGDQGRVRGGVLIRSLLLVVVARVVVTAIGGSVGAHVVDASVMRMLRVVAVRLLDVIQGGVALREV